MTYCLWSIKERILLPKRLRALWLSAVCQDLICSPYSFLPTVSCFSGPTSLKCNTSLAQPPHSILLFWPNLPKLSYLAGPTSSQFPASLAQPPNSILPLCPNLPTLSCFSGEPSPSILLIWHTHHRVSYLFCSPFPQYPASLTHPPHHVLPIVLALPAVS